MGPASGTKVLLTRFGREVGFYEGVGVGGVTAARRPARGPDGPGRGEPGQPAGRRREAQRAEAQSAASGNGRPSDCFSDRWAPARSDRSVTGLATGSFGRERDPKVADSHPEILGYAIVELAGGALTTTCSPHLENMTVSLPPPEAVAISSTGRAFPTAETVSAYDSFGVELVAATDHVRTYSLVPLATSVDSFVPLALGSMFLAEDIVRPAATSEYSLVPALNETQSFPTFFACAVVSPNIEVNPAEFPLR